MAIKDYYLTPHFRFRELACKCCGKLPHITKEVMIYLWMLEEFRVWYNKPMNLNCGYRCEDYNKSPKVKGSDISLHLGMLAVDWGVHEIVKPMNKVRLSQWRSNVADQWIRLGKKYKMYLELEINPSWIHLGASSSKRTFSRIGTANGSRDARFTNYFSKGACFDYGRYKVS